MTRATIPQIFSRSRRRATLRRLSSMQEPPFLFTEMAEDIMDRLGFMHISPEKALLSGDYSRELANHLRRTDAQVDVLDPLLIDEEQPLPFADYDLVVSMGLLDTLNDLPGALLHLRNTLAPAGLALMTFAGAGSLPVLRKSLLDAETERPAARMHPMVDTRAAAELMQRAGFARQVVDSRSVKVRYSTLDRLIGDLRANGMTNRLASVPPPLSRATAARLRTIFDEHADETGRVTETFEILTLTGWRS
ncbi:class I SAM-dependent methyltransferase [Altererythrobacter sp. SALINAS58]|uniref:methyltransferase domain-containing protein n=1 Tax=Alteripontixanthobacter muriae TaxID=2705546 RepID=UPI0015752FED|nr:methyltransferase domain-containing protein [Alteripontixanthobacter muriae]NTZ41827.1 class I SAM-dependent methyltransferase [Alteripontixanthobacter muriae]